MSADKILGFLKKEHNDICFDRCCSIFLMADQRSTSPSHER